MRIKLVSLLCLVMLVSSVVVCAAGNDDWTQANKTDAAADGAWEDWCEYWKNCNEEPTQMVLTPGEDETQLNFAWYSKVDDSKSGLVVGQKSNLEDAQTIQVVSKEATEGYCYNHASVANLKPNQEYYYSYKVEGKWTEAYKIHTRDTTKVQIAFVGDPQIGSSFDNVASGETKAQGQNRAVCNDSFNWNTTLEKIKASTTNLGLIVTAGDQIQTRNLKNASETYKQFNNNEVEYAGFLMPELLRTTPIATTIGNHDCMSGNYSYHFNNPNSETGLGGTYAGEDYYYTYGSAVFLMLNTNNSDTAEHEQFIKQALTKTNGIMWRIVVMHQDIFGSGEHSSDEDILALRSTLLPILRKYDVDLVLSGHDHTYSRAYIDDDDTSYDDVSVETGSFANQEQDTKQQINNYNLRFSKATFLRLRESLIIKSGYTKLFNYNAGIMGRQNQSLIRKYMNNYSNTIRYTGSKGIVFLTANSSSGSKYYKLLKEQQGYVEMRSQENEPSYTIIDITKKEIVINTWLTLEEKRLDKTIIITKSP